MKTETKNTRCGKTMSGYGNDDLKKNLENHERFCPACQNERPKTVTKKVDDTIIESITSDNKKIINDVPKGKKKGGILNSFKKSKKDKK